MVLQGKRDEEKVQLQQSKEQLLAKQIEVKEMVHIELVFVTVIEVKVEERVP
jgi:hypothetical protein